MANPARDARQKAQARWPGASVSARGRNWIRHQHPSDPNKFMLDASIGPMHIEGTETEIDTAWQPSTGAWQHEMTLADFQAHARSVFNAGNLLEFRMGDEWVIFDPQSINWINQDNSRHQIAIKQAVTGIVEDDILRFPEGYGPGRHFRYQNQTARLQKLITIDSLSDLPAPTVAGPDIWFEAEFSISTSAGVDFYLDGVKWAKANNVRVKSANRIEFRDAATGAQTLWWLDFPRAFDSSGLETFGEIEVRRQGGPTSLFITIRIPKTWIDQAVFPIFIDPTIDAQVSASDEDAFENSSGVVSITASTSPDIDVAGEYTGQYFGGISGLSGVTIDVSYVTIHFFHVNLDEPYHSLYAEDAEAPPVFTTATNDISSRISTTATVLWDNTGLGAPGAFNSPSLNTVIQELADSYDPSAIVIIVTPAGADSTRDWGQTFYDGSTTDAPKLHIEYTAGGSTFTLVCDAGSYATTGQAASLIADRTVPLNLGSYAITGQTASLLKGFALALDQGSYSVTGQVATLTVDRVLALNQGSYAVSGQVTELLVGRIIDLAAGSYAVTGQAVTLNKGFTLIADLGSYTVAGQAVGLIASRILSFDLGSYAISGQSASLIAGRIIDLAQGSYSLTGQDTSLLIARVLALNLGTYTVNGIDVTLTYTPIGGFTITLDLGNYAVTGQDAGLIVDRSMALDQGSYAITGNTIGLVIAAAIVAIADFPIHGLRLSRLRMTGRWH